MNTEKGTIRGTIQGNKSQIENMWVSLTDGIYEIDFKGMQMKYLILFFILNILKYYKELLPVDGLIVFLWHLHTCVSAPARSPIHLLSSVICEQYILVFLVKLNVNV